jgi:hypothetical protein
MDNPLVVIAASDHPPAALRHFPLRMVVVLPVQGFPIVRQWYVLRRRPKRLSAAARTSGERLPALDLAASQEDLGLARSSNSAWPG